MELTHEGKSYKLIVVSEISSIPEDDISNENCRYIIDYRTFAVNVIITTLTTFCRLIQSPNVSFVWLNCSSSKFFEIKERLRKLFTENGDVSGQSRDLTVLKLSTHEQSLPAAEALKISIDVRSFGKNLLDIACLMDAHPGILHGKVHLKNSHKRKKQDASGNSNDSAVALATCRDKRRPSKRVFKALKNMQNDKSDDFNPNRCYMCNSKGSLDYLCDGCHVLNGNVKRVLCDLKGRYAIVTGGRIKIGFETCLRLLRDGCFVIVTTRFTVDAAKRFSTVKDFDVWKHRLKICRLDLQDMRTIEEFLVYVKQNIPHLDILINNAAQTIYRPFQYYESLICDDVKCLPSLSENATNLLVSKKQAPMDQPLHGSIVPLHSLNCLSFGKNSHEFPDDQKDEHGEQLDLRLLNSWTYNLDEVPLQELLQVLTINAVGPFILTSKLKPLLKQSPFERKFVVNVSAMEGQFSRVTKGHRHPHTNMAKAALNMMTRTSGLEYQMDGIYMTAVDTGWVTDERPFQQARHEAEVKGFVPPLDCQDGAARVYHPIVHGLNPNNFPYFSVFLKDFKPHNCGTGDVPLDQGNTDSTNKIGTGPLHCARVVEGLPEVNLFFLDSALGFTSLVFLGLVQPFLLDIVRGEGPGN